MRWPWGRNQNNASSSPCTLSRFSAKTDLTGSVRNVRSGNVGSVRNVRSVRRNEESMNRGPLTQEEMNEIRDRERRATPGPWFPVSMTPKDGIELHLAFSMNRDKSKWTYLQLNEHDIEFLRSCREDVARLLATIDAITAEKQVWRNSTNQVIDALKDTFLEM